jgi:hypothetical protein
MRDKNQGEMAGAEGPAEPGDDSRSYEIRVLNERLTQLEVYVSELRHKAGLTEVDELYERAMADR